MQPKYTTEQRLAYQYCRDEVRKIAEAVARKHGRIDEVCIDDGEYGMLPDTAAHKLRIPTLDGPRDVVIPGHWFCDPDHYKGDIERAVEAVFAPVAASR